ncbi:unnamed protein product [Aspergillus oryzae]|uniref:Unnamed protein product n=1 Tax=Aspergillus oryzae TaxID=5062 RepID=A0AAN4Z1C3_ASPOZ|nr:unnamed protein product [Aspergillus oryzae]
MSCNLNWGHVKLHYTWPFIRSNKGTLGFNIKESSSIMLGNETTADSQFGNITGRPNVSKDGFISEVCSLHTGPSGYIRARFGVQLPLQVSSRRVVIGKVKTPALCYSDCMSTTIQHFKGGS